MPGPVTASVCESVRLVNFILIKLRKAKKNTYHL